MTNIYWFQLPNCVFSFLFFKCKAIKRHRCWQIMVGYFLMFPRLNDSSINQEETDESIMKIAISCSATMDRFHYPTLHKSIFQSGTGVHSRLRSDISKVRGEIEEVLSVVWLFPGSTTHRCGAVQTLPNSHKVSVENICQFIYRQQLFLDATLMREDCLICYVGIFIKLGTFPATL